MNVRPSHVWNFKNRDLPEFGRRAQWLEELRGPVNAFEFERHLFYRFAGPTLGLNLHTFEKIVKVLQELDLAHRLEEDARALFAHPPGYQAESA